MKRVTRKAKRKIKRNGSIKEFEFKLRLDRHSDGDWYSGEQNLFCNEISRVFQGLKYDRNNTLVLTLLPRSYDDTIVGVTIIPKNRASDGRLIYEYWVKVRGRSEFHSEDLDVVLFGLYESLPKECQSRDFYLFGSVE